MKSRILLVSLLVVLSGCAHVAPALPDCPGQDDCHFPGLKNAVSSANNLHLILVHGIGPHEVGYSDQLVNRLMKDLGLHPLSGGGVRRIVDPESKGPSALLAVRRFGGHGDRRVLTYELTWTPLVDPLKQALAYDITSAREKGRARLNRGLKRNLIDARLSDPIIYLGFERRALQFPVAYTLCSVLGGELAIGPPDKPPSCVLQANLAEAFVGIPRLQATDKIAIITFSLGSKITFDVLTGFATTDTDVAKVLSGKLTTVFMLANQLPLLELADHDPLSAQTSLGNLATALREKANCVQDEFSVVAISDPNDLLSFDISDTFALRTPGVAFANIDVPLGFHYFGLFVDPLGAHTRHEESDTVINYIVEGYGRPKARIECE